MAQEGYDTLMGLTESRYALSIIVARRAAQIKLGVPSTLDEGDLPATQNTVTVAMKELELGKPVRWGADLPSIDELRRTIAPSRPPEPVIEQAQTAPATDG